MTNSIADIICGLRSRTLWSMLGWLDVKQRYRRAVIGPFWITLSMGFMVLALGFVYSSLFGVPTEDLIPYLTVGFVIWAFLANMITEGSTVFISSEQLIKHGNVPVTLHVYRLLYRNLIIALHNVVIVLAVFWYYGLALTLHTAWLTVTIPVVTGIMFMVALVIGAASTRFRDLSPIVASIVQVIFFVTPVLYRPEMLSPDRRIVYQLNPLYYILESLRRPLLGQPMSIDIILAIFIMLIVSWLLGVAFFSRVRSRIAYWL